MRDIVVITVDSVRRDFADSMEYLSSLDVDRGTTVGHYTRPSLAGLVSGQVASAAQKRVTSPTLAEQLSGAGYTCIGLPSSPQTDPTFNFDAGFDQFENYRDSGNRGRWYRDFLARFNTVRRLYHRVAPPQAKLESAPEDEEVLNEAVTRFDEAESPRFLWVHLTGAHRPYGRGSDSISVSLDRKALFSPNKLNESQHEEIVSKYRAALTRTDAAIKEFRSRLNADPLFVFTSDHGDEFGEENLYFHQPQRRRAVDTLTEVPVIVDGVTIPNEDPWFSLLDIAPTILSAIGLEVPDEWDGVDHTDPETTRDHAITLAPWLDEATVSYKTRNLRLVASDSNVSLQSGTGSVSVQASEVPEEVEKNLRELGYIG